MPTMRVTQGLMVDRVLNDLRAQTRRLLELQEELSTGLRVNDPSDDPLAARRAVSIRTQIGKDEQYLTNISSAGPQLLESVTVIQTTLNNLQRARELTLQGASGTYSQLQLNQMAIEINEILEGTLMEANHETSGRFVFGGTRTLQRPFLETRDAGGQITAVAYQGNDEYIRIAVADNSLVRINEPGARVFQSTQDIFQMLIDIRDNLRAGDQDSMQARLAELSDAEEQLLISMAQIGATQNRLERLTFNTEDFVQQLHGTLSDNIDADYAETVLNLNAETNAFQAALNAAARVIQPSLLDFVQ